MTDPRHGEELAAWIDRFESLAQAVPLHDPPAALRPQLEQHFDDWARARRTRRLARPEVRATLSFDSRRDLLAAGTRGSDARGGIQLAYRSDTVDLVVDVGPSRGGRRVVSGQVLAVDATATPGFEVSAVVGARTVVATETDDLGGFSLPGVPAEVDSLVFSNDEMRLVAALDLVEDR